MLRSRFVVGIGLTLWLSACSTQVTNRLTPNPIINITPAPTINIDATKTTFALALEPTSRPPGLYLVREGDTLESIALAFNTTIDEITITNKISDANIIYIGQPLIIPSLISTTNSLTQPVVLDPANNATPTP